MSKIVTQYDSPAPRGTAVFDLDGTLVDSVPDLLASANRQMATLGLAPFTAPDITPMVGDGAGALIRRLLAARGIAATPGHADAFITDYLAHVAEATRPYPGVSAMLTPSPPPAGASPSAPTSPPPPPAPSSPISACSTTSPPSAPATPTRPASPTPPTSAKPSSTPAAPQPKPS